MNNTGSKQWIAWLCAAPMPVIGIAVGLSLCKLSSVRYVATVQAEHPGADVCGLPIVGCLILGLLGGSLGGILVGAGIAALVTRFVRRRGRPDTGNDTAPGKADPTTALGPAGPRWDEMHREIDLVRSLMDQAAEQGDDDVLRKLSAHKAGLEKRLGLYL